MAADIAPELLEQIKKAAARLENQNALVQAFREKSENKTAKLEDVHGYALGLGESASAALLDVIKSGVLPDDKFYFNIANRTVRPLLTDDIDAIQDAAAEVQKAIDEANDIGLNSVRADFPESRVAGIIDKLDESTSLDQIRYWLGEPIVNLLESSFDSWVQANAESRYQTGLSAVVVRTAHAGACAWCRRLAGTYDYESVRYDSEVWERHRYCRCVVIYENGKIRQSAWSRKIWRSSPEELERRRNAGNDLFRMTPELMEELNANLERDREVARLMRENPGLTKDNARYRVNRYGDKGDKKENTLEKYSSYHYNENGTIIVTDDWTDRENVHIPGQYKPYAVIDTVSQRGTQRDRTFFDAEGWQVRQISNGPHGNPKRHPFGKHGEHAHDIIWRENGTQSREPRDLTDAERKENADIL